MAGRHARPTRRAARAGAFALQRQELTQSARRSRRRRVLGRSRLVLASAATVAGAVTVGMVGGTGTFALWSSSREVPGSEVHSGGSGLIITGDEVTAENVLPGEVLYPDEPLTITNTGDVDLTITSATVATAYPGEFELRIFVTTLGADCSALDLAQYDALSTTPVELPQFIVPAHEGSSMTLCTQITVLEGAVPGVSAADFQLDIEAVQTES